MAAASGGRYIIGTGTAGSDRLRILADATWPSSEAFLRAAGLAEGIKVLDAGCGNGAVTLRIAACTGPSGRVTGLDRDPDMIRIARDDAVSRGRVVDFRQHDLETSEPLGEGYDLVYARLILSHLGDPVDALGRLAAALRPGGRLAVEDVDFRGHFCHPACPAFERYVRWYEAAAMGRGADPHIGPRLLGMMLDAGLQEVKLRVVLPTFYEGGGKLMALVTLRAIRDAVLASATVDEDELDMTLEEIESFTLEPRSIMSLPHFFQVSGAAGA